MTVPLSAEERRRAVYERAASADESFVYAVRTTGIYCRPSCPARRPRPDNMLFFDSPDEARAAGFRPCRRCRPDWLADADRADNDDAASADPHAAAIAEACRLLERSDEPPGLSRLAALAGLSEGRFHRVFKEAVGMTPRAYAEGCRLARLRETLNGAPSVMRAVFEAGFGSTSRGYATAARLGLSPSDYRKGGAGEVIGYAVSRCSLGHVIVAGTDRGLVAIALGDDADDLVAHISGQFPNARLEQATSEFEATVNAVVLMIEAPGEAPRQPLPLDVRGTAFQLQVWQGLSAIPPGETVTYGELAERIGKPRAVRAVARACGANRLAVAIPCHRVVGRTGALTGYRWGVERKRALLKRERKDRDGD